MWKKLVKLLMITKCGMFSKYAWIFPCELNCQSKLRESRINGMDIQRYKESIDSSTASGVTDTPLYRAMVNNQRSLEDRPAGSDQAVMGCLNVGRMGEGGQYAVQEDTTGDVWKRDDIEGWPSKDIGRRVCDSTCRRNWKDTLCDLSADYKTKVIIPMI